MKDLRCVIVGARRVRTGLGGFIGQKLQSLNGENISIKIVATIGTSQETASKAGKAFEERSGNGIVRGYGSTEEEFELCVKETVPNVIVICSPSITHSEWIMRALKHNLHVLCEKPLAPGKSIHELAEISEQFKLKGLILMESTQWRMLQPLLDNILSECCQNYDHVWKEFRLRMEPPHEKAIDRIEDVLPHPLGLLQRKMMSRDGSISELVIEQDKEQRKVAAKFRYNYKNGANENASCNCVIEAVDTQRFPRGVEIEINGISMKRVVDPATYSASFVISPSSDHKTVPIGDPLDTLVKYFVDSVLRQLGNDLYQWKLEDDEWINLGVRESLRCLGLRKPHHTMYHPNNPAIRGLIGKVKHLVRVQVTDTPLP